MTKSSETKERDDMSSVFNNYLADIANILYAPGVHDDYFKVLDSVRTTVESNSLLRSICVPRFLPFGSAAHGIRMHDDNEYDVMIELEFANYEQILVQPDPYRPGYVHLRFDQPNSPNFVKDTLLDNLWYLKNKEIRILMDSILSDIHDRPVWDSNGLNVYRLHYEWRKNCHTIIATSVNRQFSIDFVPAIKVLFNEGDIQVVPKSVPGPKDTSGCTFIVSNIREEMRLLQEGGKVMTDAVMLLKARCESYSLPKIRFYHLVSLGMLFIEAEDVNQHSLENVFLGMLSDLCDALWESQLSYHLYPDLNLLSNFKPHQLAKYEEVLNDAYNTLKTYPHQEKLSYNRCSWHFLGDE